MIPEKNNNTTASTPQLEKIGSFNLFDIEHFVNSIDVIKEVINQNS